MNITEHHQFKKIIGIVGGVGPEAGVEQAMRIVKLSQELYNAQQDYDYPRFILDSLNMYGFNETGIIEEYRDDLFANLSESMNGLVKLGAAYIIMACNTLHEYVDLLQKEVPVPIVSMIDAVTQAAKNDGCTTAGLLCSATTNRSGIYQLSGEQHGVRIITPTNEEQEQLDNVILNVMGGKQGTIDQTVLQTIGGRMTKDGASHIILGCTELPMAIGTGLDFPYFDSMSEVAKKVLTLSK